jgi:hypothetical protein
MSPSVTTTRSTSSSSSALFRSKSALPRPSCTRRQKPSALGCQASRLALTLRVVRKLMLLSVQRLQSGVGITPTTLVLGQPHHPGEVSLREPLGLLTEGGPAPAQLAWRACNSCGNQYPPRARFIACAIISGAASSSHRSRQTSFSSARAGCGAGQRSPPCCTGHRKGHSNAPTRLGSGDGIVVRAPKGLRRNKCFTMVVGWTIWCSSTRRGIHRG